MWKRTSGCYHTGAKGDKTRDCGSYALYWNYGNCSSEGTFGDILYTSGGGKSVANIVTKIEKDCILTVFV